MDTGGLPASGHYFDYTFNDSTDYGHANSSGVSSSVDGMYVQLCTPMSACKCVSPRKDPTLYVYIYACMYVGFRGLRQSHMIHTYAKCPMQEVGGDYAKVT